MNDIITIKSITEFSQLAGLPEPKHPLIGVFEDEEMRDHMKIAQKEYAGLRFTLDMYSIMFKDKIRGSMTYGYNEDVKRCQQIDFFNATLLRS